MIDYNVKIDLDPTNKYEKAKKDMLQAMQSISELTPEQKQQLAYGFIGAKGVADLLYIMSTMNRQEQN